MSEFRRNLRERLARYCWMNITQRTSIDTIHRFDIRPRFPFKRIELYEHLFTAYPIPVSSRFRPRSFDIFSVRVYVYHLFHYPTFYCRNLFFSFSLAVILYLFFSIFRTILPFSRNFNVFTLYTYRIFHYILPPSIHIYNT